MKINLRKRRTAVSPILATLMMIAVAVAMSVIIFVWSQGFLSQTSSAAGGQQAIQNQAAQSSISIESVTFVDCNTPANPCTAASARGGMTLIVRNVGAVSLTLGSISITGISSNGANDFTGSVIATLTSGTWTVITSDTGTNCWAGTSAPTSGTTSLPKGSAVSIVFTGGAAGACTGTTTQLESGDVISIKVTTSVGTFGSSQYTAP